MAGVGYVSGGKQPPGGRVKATTASIPVELNPHINKSGGKSQESSPHRTDQVRPYISTAS